MLSQPPRAFRVPSSLIESSTFKSNEFSVTFRGAVDVCDRVMLMGTENVGDIEAAAPPQIFAINSVGCKAKEVRQ
jgi:hypothetical protein